MIEQEKQKAPQKTRGLKVIGWGVKVIRESRGVFQPDHLGTCRKSHDWFYPAQHTGPSKEIYHTKHKQPSLENLMRDPGACRPP